MSLPLQARSLSPARSVESVLQPRARCRRIYGFISKQQKRIVVFLKLILFFASISLFQILNSNELWKIKISHIYSTLKLFLSIPKRFLNCRQISFLIALDLTKTLAEYNKSHSLLLQHLKLFPPAFRGEKPYTCNVCQKSFSDPSARRRHVMSHSGKKPFTCSCCSLSFTRLDNLKTHTKSHNKERAAATEAQPDSTEAPTTEVRNVLQLQQFQLPSGSEQEIQLVVTGDVENINFVPTQDQEISIITTAEGEATESSHSRLTLLTQPSGNMALVAQGGVVEPSPHIQAINMLEGQMTHQPEQMHVITLSKEAMEHLQAHHGPPQPIQVAQRPIQQLQVMQQSMEPESSRGSSSGEKPSQAIHISSQSSQPISISQTSEQISSHHLQGQMFQIQAGTVSYLYTTGVPQES